MDGHMTDKLTGFVLIANTLLPGVFLVLVLGSGVYLWQTLKHDVVPKFGEISDSLSSLKTAAGQAAETVQEVAGKAMESASVATTHAKDAMDTLSPLAAKAEALRNSVTTVIDPIAKVNVVYPSIVVKKSTLEFDKTYSVIGRIHIGPVTYISGSSLKLENNSPFAGLRTPFDDIAAALDIVGDEVEHAKSSATDAAWEIARLGPLVETFTAFKDQFEYARASLVGLSDTLRSALGLTVWMFGIFALLALPWLALSYFTWSVARLRRGYALLTG